MSGLLAYTTLGLLLPLVGGMGLARALFPAVDKARTAEWLAVGALTGPAMASLAMHLVPGDIKSGAWLAVGLLSAMAITGWLKPASKGMPRGPVMPGFPRLTIVAAVAVVACLIQFGLMAHEVLVRPTFPWDAWGTWTYKAKAWFLVGALPEFAEAGHWSPVATGSAPDGTYPVTAPHYPTLVAGFQVYLATWLGEWNEPLLNLPWLLVHVALALLVFGEGLRILGRRDGAALLACLVSSIPLLATHTALAGYMDLWVAAALTALCIVVCRLPWQARRATLLAIVLAAVLAFLKMEGIVWIGAVTAALIVPALGRFRPKNPAWRYLLTGPALTGAAVAIVLGMAWAGTSITVPYFGILSFSFNPEAGRLLASLLVSWNWHLFFAGLAACLAFDAWTRKKDHQLRRWRSIAFVGIAVVAVICLVTRVAGDSPDLRNYNRIILQWVPVWALYGAAVVAAARRQDRGR